MQEHHKMLVADIRQYFINELESERFVTDRSGGKTIEFLGASFIADEPAIFGTVNQEYVDAEIKWYNSRSTNVNDIGEKVPEAWKLAANKYGEINSNYGHLIFSEKFHYQYNNAVNELIGNPDSRRAIMVYNRPSIWLDYNEQGKNDMICTNAVTYYIRNNMLHAVVQMRSNDALWGYKNDRAWAKYVLESLVLDYNIHMFRLPRAQRVNYKEVIAGNIYWQVQSLHIYDRHFHLVKNNN